MWRYEINLDKEIKDMDKEIKQTIDVTPKWEDLVPALLEAYKNADLMKQEDIREEFLRMAKAADLYNGGEK
jgi:hypothetical protein